MRKLLLLIFILLSLMSVAQTDNFRFFPQNTPTNTAWYFHGVETRAPVCTADKGYLFSYFPWASNLHSLYPVDFYTIKTDSNFIPQWRKPYFARSIALPTGGIILVYNTSPTNYSYNGATIEKVTASGAQVWIKKFTGEDIHVSDGVLAGGDVRIVGRKRFDTGYPFFYEVSQPYSMLMDTSGNFSTQAIFTGSYMASADFSAIERDNAGNYFMYSDGINNTGSRMLLAKFSSSFTPLWATQFTVANTPISIVDIEVLPTGGILATGNYYNISSGAEAALLKFSPQGDLVASKYISGRVKVSGLTKKSANRYVVSCVGMTVADDSVFTFETDSSFNISWFRYRATGFGVASSVISGSLMYTPAFNRITPFLIVSDTLGVNCSSIARPFSLSSFTFAPTQFTMGPSASSATLIAASFNSLSTQSYVDSCRCIPFLTSPPVSQQLCTGSTGVVTMTGSTVPSWYDAQSGGTYLGHSNTFTLTSSSPTVMTIYAQDSTCGPPNRVPVTFTVNNIPSLTVTASHASICSGGSVTFTASGAPVIQWAGAASGATVSRVPMSSSVYTVTGYSNAGCSASTTASVIVVQTPAFTVAGPGFSTCIGQSLTFSVNGSAANYSWSTGQSGTSVVITPTPGVTSITVNANNNGCIKNVQFYAFALNLPTVYISPGSATLCSGYSLELTASGATSYTWNGQHSGTTYTALPAATTIYTVVGTNPAGCQSSKTIAITVVPGASLIVSPSSLTMCAGSSSVLTASGANSYTWSGQTTGATLGISPVSNNTYVVIAESVNNCTASVAVPVQVLAQPFIMAVANPSNVCAGHSLELVVGGAVTYSWSTGGTGFSEVITPSANGVYYVTGYTSNGCSTTRSVAVTVNPLPVISAPDGSICAGGSFTLTPAGAQSYSYAGGGPVVSPTADKTYVITGTGTDGCVSNPLVVTVKVYSLPVVYGSSGSICAGQTFSIIPSGAHTYSITGGSFVVSPAATSYYTLSGTSAQGCTAVPLTVSVAVNANPTLAVADVTACIGETASLQVQGAATYSWNDGGTMLTGSQQNVPVSQSVTYSVTGKDVNGCVATATMSLLADACTGLNENLATSVVLYPNPASTSVEILLDGAGEGMVLITDVSGKLIATAELMNGRCSFNVSSFAKGFYVVSIRTTTLTTNLKLVRE